MIPKVFYVLEFCGNGELIPNEQKMDEKSQCNFVQVTEVMDFYKL